MYIDLLALKLSKVLVAKRIEQEINGTLQTKTERWVSS
jgi:hypothetical protein